MIRRIRIALLSLLSAGILAFCSAQPVAAQPARSATGQYIDCGQVTTDVSLMVRAFKLANDYIISGKASMEADWYTRVVIMHAQAAVKSGDPVQYVRALHKSCLLGTT